MMHSVVVVMFALLQQYPVSAQDPSVVEGLIAEAACLIGNMQTTRNLLYPQLLTATGCWFNLPDFTVINDRFTVTKDDLAEHPVIEWPPLDYCPISVSFLPPLEQCPVSIEPPVLIEQWKVSVATA